MVVIQRLIWALPFGLTASITEAFQPALNQFVQTQHRLQSSHDSNEAIATPINYSLPKPLGLILEEVEEGKAAGVFVLEVGDNGSAFAHADSIAGATLATVQGEDVTRSTFDAVMEKIMSAPDTVDISFLPKEEEPGFPVGTPVDIVVREEGKQDLTLSVKVGDNLRQALFDGGFEVYRGMQKLGNCGGAGQCTYCAMDFLESDGWLERSDYENKKLKKNPAARLSCLNSVQGPAVIQKAQR